MAVSTVTWARAAKFLGSAPAELATYPSLPPSASAAGHGNSTAFVTQQ